MHGGLFSRDDVKLDELRTIDRNRQPGDEGTWVMNVSILFTLTVETKTVKLMITLGTSCM